jgi:Trypsin
MGVHNRLNMDRTSTIIRKIQKAVVHPKFDIFTFDNDIAVLHLSEEVEFTRIIKPACLPTQGERRKNKPRLTLTPANPRCIFQRDSPLSADIEILILRVLCHCTTVTELINSLCCFDECARKNASLC